MDVRRGIDLINVGRFQQEVEKGILPPVRDIFTQGEQAYCESMRLKYEHYAARFAAKKSVMKALGIKSHSPKLLQGIEVCRYPSGKPHIRFSPDAAEDLKLPVRYQIELSIAHEREYAVATVILVVP